MCSRSWGVKTPARREIVRAALKGVPDRTKRFEAAELLWRGEFREERYVALDILAGSHPTLHDLPVLEAMLPGCDWWDLLDSLIGQIGRVLIPFPELRREKVRTWRESDHLWTRRAAILAQLHAKAQTDTELLYETVALLMPEQEFFMNRPWTPATLVVGGKGRAPQGRSKLKPLEHFCSP